MHTMYNTEYVYRYALKMHDALIRLLSQYPSGSGLGEYQHISTDIQTGHINGRTY
jgi:hypothetical protein